MNWYPESRKLADVLLAVDCMLFILECSSLGSIERNFIISSSTYKFIKQNLKISLIYNLLTIPDSYSAFADIPPWLLTPRSIVIHLLVGKIRSKLENH